MSDNLVAEVAKVDILIPYTHHVTVVIIVTSMSPAMQAFDAEHARLRHHCAQ